MNDFRQWGADIWSGSVSAFIWFSPAHCHYISTAVAMIIGVLTLFFITLPRVFNSINSIMKCPKVHEVKK